jgi:defect-in-organelle-trafficking protein DotB
MSEGQNFAGKYEGGTFEIDGRIGPDEFDDLLLWCVERKVSDVTLQSGGVVKADIGGELVEISNRALTHPEIEEVVRYIYGENGPGEVKSGNDLDPAHVVKNAEGKRKRYRVNVTGCSVNGVESGIEITIRTLPEVPIPIEQLGVEQEILDNWRPPQGMVLITGPTGSGKSTLLSSGMRMILEKEDANEKMLEYSKPIEFVYDKVQKPSSLVSQSEVGKHLRPRNSTRGDEESEFAYCVRNALRRKPTIILIGESRDKATIQASIEAANTGHVLYSTMHTIGVAETIRRAVMTFPGNERHSASVDIMETLRMIVTQILLSKVGGGKVACREFMIFDQATRTRFLNEEVDSWPSLARKLLNENLCVGRSMSVAAKELLDDGKISKETYKYINTREG